MEKLTITKDIYQESVSSFMPYGKITLEQVLKTFKDKYDFVKNLYPQYDYLTIEFEFEYGYYDSCDYMAKFFGSRLETDEEYKARIDKAKKVAVERRKALLAAHQINEEKEKTLYEKLKKKFGV